MRVTTNNLIFLLLIAVISITLSQPLYAASFYQHEVGSQHSQNEEQCCHTDLCECTTHVTVQITVQIFLPTDLDELQYALLVEKQTDTPVQYTQYLLSPLLRPPIK